MLSVQLILSFVCLCIALSNITAQTVAPCSGIVLANVTRTYVENKASFDTCASNSFNFFPPSHDLIPARQLLAFCYEPACVDLFRLTDTVNVPKCSFNGVNLYDYFHYHAVRCIEILKRNPVRPGAGRRPIRSRGDGLGGKLGKMAPEEPVASDEEHAKC